MMEKEFREVLVTHISPSNQHMAQQTIMMQELIPYLKQTAERAE